MSDPYIGEIRMFGGNFAPEGWQLCNGSSLSISEYGVLFQLIGTTYGGDGQTTFKVPDLRGRWPVHQGSLAGVSTPLGQAAGSESVPLLLSQMPSHTHALKATASAATTANPTGATLAQTTPASLYLDDNPGVSLAGQALGMAGGGQPHENRSPYLAVNFIISLYGIYPSQS
ncbi:phage tail protein [Deinococcus gobiensis]|uniref:Microcystin dependent protein n=1 Tax=Deinococcus gobiensis (strain DSM 21396 / JCM 16679 / CGMCC 1.7299 / I-0) TaxID=745776 RepID=H8H0H7_DEIGI|nr:tail fiber protein [Deinococcus gobiensis]AFD27229.1 Microcystin dependent protein [Deinococcus gobiensis I-0]